jgi:excisionase family DNA binding protein
LTAVCGPLEDSLLRHSLSRLLTTPFIFLPIILMGQLPNSPRPGIEDAPTETPETPALFTVDDVARQLNVSRSKIYGLIARGDLTVHRLPAIRVSQEDLSQLLANTRSQRSRPTNRGPSTIRLKHLR